MVPLNTSPEPSSPSAVVAADGPARIYVENVDYVFAGWQQRGPGKDPMRLVTDLRTESTISFLHGESVHERIERHRREWEG